MNDLDRTPVRAVDTRRRRVRDEERDNGPVHWNDATCDKGLEYVKGIWAASIGATYWSGVRV